MLGAGPVAALAFCCLLASPRHASSQQVHPHATSHEVEGHSAHAPSAHGAEQHADDFAADMGIVHEMLMAHDAIARTVINLPNGVRTVTESDDPQVAAYIKAHVASMDQRLATGEVFNMNSSTIPRIFASAERIHTEIVETSTGVEFTQTTEDPELVSTLQAHAAEVSELAREGMAAMMRGMMGQGGVAMERGAHAAGGHAHDASSVGAPLSELGNAALAVIREVVDELNARPDTDWSQVDLEALRQHLMDMERFTLEAEVVESEVVDGGLRVVVRGTSPAASASIRRVLHAHAPMLEAEMGWTASVTDLDDGTLLQVTSERVGEAEHIRGLGYIGLMATGSHHQEHHWLIATGGQPHVHPE